MSSGVGDWCVILGVSGGTGASAARALAREPGLNVFGAHRGKHPGQATAVEEAVLAAGRRCHMRVAPAGSAEDAHAGVEELARVAGPKSVRIFVHSIADASYGALAAHPKWPVLEAKKFARTFDSMAHSFVWWAHEMLRQGVLADGARLVALSNPMVDSVVHGWGLVAAAKAALEIYVRQLGHELGPLGYRVSLLKFGMVETRAIQIAFEKPEWERVKGEISAATPARRLCTTDEVGAFLSVLAGRNGDWFNAGMIDFTGGQIGSLLDGVFNRHDA
jgi:NAD(P)-dependent dehydrogenase (short-subunit alcohol dehydrogenase family)